MVLASTSHLHTQSLTSPLHASLLPPSVSAPYPSPALSFFSPCSPSLPLLPLLCIPAFPSPPFSLHVFPPSLPSSSPPYTFTSLRTSETPFPPLLSLSPPRPPLPSLSLSAPIPYPASPSHLSPLTTPTPPPTSLNHTRLSSSILCSTSLAAILSCLRPPPLQYQYKGLIHGDPEQTNHINRSLY